MEDDQTGDESSYSVSPLVTPEGIALSDSEKAEALADNMEAQFQPVTDPSVPAVEIVDVALRSYLMTPASEPKLTNNVVVQEAIRGLKVQQGSGPERYPEQGLEASSTASGSPPGRDSQLDPPHSSFPYRVEARLNDLHI